MEDIKRRDSRKRKGEKSVQDSIHTVFGGEENNLPEPILTLNSESKQVNWIRRFVRRHPKIGRLWMLTKRGLRWLTSNTIMGLFVAPAIATAIVSVVLSETNSSGSVVTGVAAALTYVLTLAIIQASLLLSIRPWFIMLRAIARDTKDQQRPFLERLVTARLREVKDTIERLVKGDFRPDPPEAMASYFRNFFEQGGSRYTGVDSHLPSEYLATYGWFLEVHKGLNDTARAQQSTRQDERIVVAHGNDLTDDYLRNSTAYRDFIRWHERERVELFWIDPDKVSALRKKHGIPEHVDVSLFWGNYAVAFQNDPDGSPRLSMRFPTDGDGTMKWSDVEAFVSEVRRSAESLSDPPGLEVVDEDMAEAWETYVNSDKRMEESGPLVNFLMANLAGRRHILDSAAGIGCESVVLLKHGFSVTSNEIDANLAAIANDFATARGLKLDLRKHLWERLAEEILGGWRFDAVLCLGNSLCLVNDYRRRAQCLRSFFDVLEPGGLLVIDERNFTYMLENRKEIESDPTKFGPIRGDVMYRGEAVRGVPLKISNSSIGWRLFNNARDVITREDLERNLRGTELTLHPFKHGELLKALKDAGFQHIRVFADLEDTKCLDGMPDYAQVSNAAFFTYVAQRPDEVSTIVEPATVDRGEEALAAVISSHSGSEL